MEAAYDLRVDKSGTMFLGKIGDNVGAIRCKRKFPQASNKRGAVSEETSVV